MLKVFTKLDRRRQKLARRIVGLAAEATDLLAAARRPRKPTIVYDLADPKAAENRIVADILAGRLTIRRSRKHHLMPTYVENIFQGVEADVRGSIDRPASGGSFTFLIVQGRDLSYEPRDVFDFMRVVIVMRDGREPDPAPRNLYDC